MLSSSSSSWQVRTDLRNTEEDKMTLLDKMLPTLCLMWLWWFYSSMNGLPTLGCLINISRGAEAFTDIWPAANCINSPEKELSAKRSRRLLFPTSERQKQIRGTRLAGNSLWGNECDQSGSVKPVMAEFILRETRPSHPEWQPTYCKYTSHQKWNWTVLSQWN